MNRLRTRIAPVLLVGALPFVALVACSDDDPAPTTTASVTTPEDKVTPDAEVTTGLNKMVEEAKKVAAAGSDKTAADAAYEEAHEIWEDVEGTVKQKEPDLYAQIEEDLALLKTGAGDATKAQASADSLETNVKAYLTKHPG